MPLIECVPNISEGRNSAVIKQICQAVRQGGAHLLHWDSNADANRTVLTFAGHPQEVLRSALNCMRTASQLIDMREHRGAHPRLGAVDVCPLVPVEGITLQETAQLAKKLARQAAEELNVPVYLYEAAAASLERRNLAFIRKGEYESLPQKLTKLLPDFGPQTFTPQVQKSGAFIVGARNFLIAFNISLNTQDVQAAKQIAALLREKSGGLPAVKAIGWQMPSYQCAQVSCNLTDFRQTPLHKLFETCKQHTADLGIRVTGSELIGLIPLEALLHAGRFYHPEPAGKDTLIQTAVQLLGLNRHAPFKAEEKILEYCLHAAQ